MQTMRTANRHKVGYAFFIRALFGVRSLRFCSTNIALNTARLVSILCILASPFVATSAFAKWQSDTQNIMGTEVNLTLWHPDASVRNNAISAVMTEMRRLDKSLSPYIPSSALAQVNKHAAQKVMPINDELYYLVERSVHYSNVTHGRFDITFASVGWHYDYRNKQQPTPKQTQTLLPAINYHWLKLNKNPKSLSFAHPNVRIDLGGIAKGYAVDRAAKILTDHNIKHATISAGGDSRVLGNKRGKPWLIGIKNPRLKAPTDLKAPTNHPKSTHNNPPPMYSAPPVLTLPLEDIAISTSGDYERYFFDEATGQRVHHIINPKTGRPTHGIMSVTVIGPNGLDTDALSTSVFVLGVEEGLTLINTLATFDCIIISTDGQVHYSNGLMPPASV